MEVHTFLDVYKVASKIIGLTQFWAAGIPLSVRHKNKHPHPLIYLGGPEVGSKQNILIPMYMSKERSKVYEGQSQKESEGKFFQDFIGHCQDCYY